MVSASDEHAQRMRERVGGFFGHPRGLGYLVAVEGFWAFSYFGLQTILTLYMTRQLLATGHAEHILGFAAYRHMLEGGGPPLGAVDIASQTYGLLTSLAYALPLVGAVVADRWLGQKRTMILGLVILSVAMAVMVFEQTFLIAAALIVLGNGLLKCNLMVSIGRLYAPDDTRRTSAFAFYLIAANIGSFSSPLVAGTLAERVGFQAGLIALAVGMAGALAAYLAGLSHVSGTAAPASESDSGKAVRLSSRDWLVAAVLVAVLAPEVVHFAAYQQSFNIFPIWAADHVQRTVLGFQIPVTWFSTLDGLLTIAGAAVTIRLWDRQAADGRPMGDLTKIAIGCAMGLVGFAILAVGAMAPGKAPLGAAVGYFLLVDPAIIWVDTVTLALISRAAPASINSTMVGVYTLAMSASYFGTGQLGRLYEHMSPPAFWAVHAGADVICLVFLALAGPTIARVLAGKGATAEAAPASAPAG